VELGRAVSTGMDTSYYRSQRFSADAPPPTSSKFGPPPLEKQGEGRYTEGKQVVLYLSRTPKVAALEKPLQGSSKPKLYIQEFHLSVPGFKFLRLTQDLESKATSLQYFLLESEYLPEESSFNPYRPTQFLAFLCGLRGIRAIEYPSVRAGYKDDPDAVNLVVLGRAVDAIKRMTRNDPFEYPPECSGTDLHSGYSIGGNSGDATHDSSLPVPEPVCVCLCVLARRQVRRTGRRQTGRSSLRLRSTSVEFPIEVNCETPT